MATTTDYVGLQNAFLADVRILLGDVRVLWTPDPDDTLTFTEYSIYARAGTYTTTIASRLRRLGLGWALAFDASTSTDAQIADAATMSVGTGTVDGALSLITLANVTNTALNRGLFGKRDSVLGREYHIYVDGADLLTMQLADNSTLGTRSRASSTAITQGSWHLLAGTYNGVETAPQNGMRLFQDGAEITSTGSTVGSYTAMEDTAGPFTIGSDDASGGGSYFSGQIALVIVAATEVPIITQQRLVKMINEFYGLGL